MADQSNNPVESWEQREAQIRKEKADEFSKLTPSEQANILAKEKADFSASKNKLREDLGYKPFDPEKHKKSSTGFEHSLDKKTDKKDKLPPEDIQRFYDLFNAATENITGKKAFPFEASAVDDLGKTARFKAVMSNLTDHSEKLELNPAQILERLNQGKSSPYQIGVTIVVDMGEQKDNNLGLTNLSMEIPLAALLSGHFTERISHFTNMVLFAATIHDKAQKESSKIASASPKTDKKPESPILDRIHKTANRYGLQVYDTSSQVTPTAGALEQGDISAITFACNNGSVWGQVDLSHKMASGAELQESVDKISKEK